MKTVAGTRDHWVERGFFSDHADFAAFAEELEARLGNQRLSLLPRLCFVLVKPDAIVSGKAAAVLSYLSRSGFRAIDSFVHDAPRHDEFEELYRYNLLPENDDNVSASWSVNRQMYVLGPWLGLLLLHEESTPDQAGLSPHGRLRQLKGSASPTAALPGTLRHDLGANNRLLNLVHAADDAPSTAREYLIFRPLSALATALDRVCNLEAGGELPANVTPDVTELAPSPASKQDLWFVGAMLRLKLRLLARAPVGGSFPGGTPLAVHYTECLLRAPERNPINQYLELAKQEVALLNCERSLDDCTRRILANLAISDVRHLDRVQTALDEIEALSITIPAWDRITIVSTLHYRDDFIAAGHARAPARRKLTLAHLLERAEA